MSQQTRCFLVKHYAGESRARVEARVQRRIDKVCREEGVSFISWDSGWMTGAPLSGHTRSSGRRATLTFTGALEIPVHSYPGALDLLR